MRGEHLILRGDANNGPFTPVFAREFRRRQEELSVAVHLFTPPSKNNSTPSSPLLYRDTDSQAYGEGVNLRQVLNQQPYRKV